MKASVALHAAAIPALAIAPRQWPWVVGTLVADHHVVIAGGLWPRSALLGPNLRRSKAAAAANAVVLTFDDGPDPVVTPRVLDLLDARGFKATFFCIGEHAASIRARICQGASWLGLELDEAANELGGPRISRVPSRVSAWVVPTNEELMIALHVRRVLQAM